MGNKRWSDEELLEWFNSFKNKKDLRENHFGKYQACLRRGIGYSDVDSRRKILYDRKLVREEKRRKAEEKKRIREEKKLELKKMNSPVKLDAPSKIYRPIKLENGNIICGRCLEEKEPSKKSGNVCRKCYLSYIKYNVYGVDHNKFNIRDQFCNTKITHYDKVFDIGVRVDERTQNYLSLIGYEFIFKEVYKD